MPSPVMSTSNRNDDHPTSVAVSTVGLRKTYGDKTVLDGIDLTVPAGTIFSLLGPNGAGKTTVVNILSTLISADGGQARIDGYDITGEA
ncbi:ATP-binding cassette domain-containing protein, partial [Streptomyces sp. NPDC088794]|uniref:ATP-binding cassette domain-containing protein n=1 Tax=Streptomyces sp. NPDC088794 TaxID=3365902 RepID=UPI003809F65D